MKTAIEPKADFDRQYQTHRQHLKLKGLQPKTIDAYARGIRRMGDYFDHQIDNLTPAQLTHYFSDLIASHSCSAVKLDLHAFKFYTLHVLGKPWAMPHFIKPPRFHACPTSTPCATRCISVLKSPPARKWNGANLAAGCRAVLTA